MNDDGTFEGNEGNISLYTAHQINGAEGFGWSSSVSFAKIKDTEGTRIKVTSGNEHSYNYLYVKFDAPIEAGVTYTVTMDLKPLDNKYTSGMYGYWILPPEATTGNYIQFYQAMAAEDLFKKGAKFTFTPDKSYDSFYLLLREGETTDVTYNFELDNIRLTENRE